MALNCLFPKGSSLKLVRFIQIQQVANSGHAVGADEVGHLNKLKSGKREIVGYGMNGIPSYFDRADIPFPAVRFKEVTPDIQELREREKGDWKKLSIEDKKALYRASFCQTISELHAPTGDWKALIGLSLVGISAGIWLFILLKTFIFPPLPKTFEPEHQKAMLKRMIDLRMNPVDGLAAKWDYEKGKWKE